MENAKKKTASEIREEIGASFPKGLSEANYDMESYLHYRIENLEKENDELIGKLAEIRDLFDESDCEAEGHGMEDMIGYPYAVLCYAENKLKRLMEKVSTYERALAAYGDPTGKHILRAIDKGWDNESK